jgi:hypothetical protein
MNSHVTLLSMDKNSYSMSCPNNVLTKYKEGEEVMLGE